MPKKRKRGRPVGSVKAEQLTSPGPTKNSIPPTPETEVKLPPPFLDKLAPELKVAAIKINAAFMLRCRASAFKISKTQAKLIEENSSPLLRTMSFNEIEEMKDALDIAYAQWCDEMRRRKLGIANVLKMIVEAIHPYEIDRINKQSSGWAAELLLESLSLYTTIR